MFKYDAYYHIRRSHKFQPLFANTQVQALRAFYGEHDCSLIANFFSTAGEKRNKVVKYK